MQKTDSSCKSKYINNNIKCVWVKKSSRKSEIPRLEEETKFSCILSPRDVVQIQRYKHIESKRMKRQHSNINHKEAEILAILISDKYQYVIRDKEGYFMTIEELINWEDITIINMYVPNNRVPRYMKEKLAEMKGVIQLITER